jgi:RND family efflux transporter MFP subunit
MDDLRLVGAQRQRVGFRRAVACAVFLLLSATGCNRSAPSAPTAPEVVVAEVLSKRIVDWDEYSGRFAAVDSVDVRPRASGYVDEVHFREGQFVKRGDVLVTIDPRPYKADYDRAQAGIALAQSQLELAEIEAERATRLRETGAVPREELDKRISQRNQTRASVAAARATAESAALMLSFTEVHAPVDGRVSRAEVTRGNLVTGGDSGGTLLTTIVSVDPIYVYFDGDENAYLRYNAMARDGSRRSSRDAPNPVRIGLADEAGFPHEGHIDFVDNQINTKTGTIRVRAVLDNKAGLFTPGLFARVQLLGSGEYDAILVEDRAIATDQNQRFVYVLGADNKLEYRAVELGRIVDGLRVVRKGLAKGDVVVTSGLQRARPGIVVSPTQRPMGESMKVASGAAST